LNKQKLISSVLALVGVGMISVALTLESNSLSNDKIVVSNISEVNIKNMATSTNRIIKSNNSVTEDKKEDINLTAVNMEVAPASVVVPPRVEVYEGMTMEELADKLNRSLRNEMSGKGLLIAQKSIELGVDPYIATAIMLHETGCSQSSCSYIARTCYNFGGQKGSGCGAYQAYGSVDEGITGMISNLYRNYYAYGLNTVEAIGHRYAESTVWPTKINSYVQNLRAA